ncbi:MAG: PrsW family glutamic-type intramembrane protease [Minisyncoccia bacterium]
MNFEAIFFAFLVGILPAFVWLFFLLREDVRCPEPKQLILLAFLSGMGAVVIALPLEYAFADYLGTGTSSPSVLISWAIIEEVVKYGIAAAVILWRKAVDEPIDFVVYMLTTALGFAALENTLFLISPFTSGNLGDGLATESLRFIGSTLLHVLSSSVVGFALAFSYRKVETLAGYSLRSLMVIVGLILGITLHALFNLLIISGDESNAMNAFFSVWTGIVIFFALFEILKYFEYRNLPKNTC